MRYKMLLIGLLVLAGGGTPNFIWADETLDADLIHEYKKILSELSSEPEDTATLKETGKLYYFIGEVSHDRDTIKKAVSILENVLEKESGDAEVKVYLGSAYTLKARDFPLRWLANITPLGWIRIYYVRSGVNMMNDGVKADELNPVARLIRGMTRVNLPKAFLGFKGGMEDLELVLSWIKCPALNAKYDDIITDKGFISDASYRIGEVYFKEGDREKAVMLFKNAASLIPDSPIGRAAVRRLNE